jgi:hypothetical protein
MSAWPDMPEGPAGGGLRLTPRGSSLSGGGIRGYTWLMVCFFLAFLAYLLYEQTRTDITQNGTLRSISDLFVAFGSVTAVVAC